MKMKKIILAIFAFNLLFESANTQNKESTYDYVRAFKTAFYSSPSTDSRSASGKPGHKYWQNMGFGYYTTLICPAY